MLSIVSKMYQMNVLAHPQLELVAKLALQTMIYNINQRNISILGI